jgi:hypothetical protein
MKKQLEACCSSPAAICGLHHISTSGLHRTTWPFINYYIGTRASEEKGVRELNTYGHKWRLSGNRRVNQALLYNY